MLLLLTAYPRKEGFTRYCTDFFVKGVEQSGVPYEKIDLTASGIKPCKGCYHCWCTTPGKCIQNDGTASLLDKFLEADSFAVATPLYAYGVAGYLKMFIERTMPLLAPGVTTSSAGIDRNNLRYPERGPRDMTAIITGGLGGLPHSEGAVTSLRLYAESFNMRFHGAIVRSESYLLQFTDTKPKTIKTIETALEQAGRTFAAERTIDGDTIRKAQLPLAPDLATFQLYSNIYWENAMQVYGRGGSFEEVMRQTRSDLRILMNEMAHSADPVSTARIRAVLRFEFCDPASAYTITLDRGTATLDTEPRPRYDLTVSCSAELWARIVHRTADPLKALTAGEIKLSGDKELFRKIGRYFPPPNI